jgi:negative regulator of sigma E activity
MSRTIEEQLSDFLDGELPPMEEELLLRRLEQGAGHRVTLTRYALIGEVMRGNAADCARADFHQRVSDAIAEESDHAGQPAPPVRESRGGWRYAGFGLAAGIAAVAAVLLVGGNPTGPSGATTEQVATPVAQPLRFDDFDAERLPRSRIAPARLTAYLVSHGDYSRGLSRQIMNSHVVNQRAELLQASYQQGAASD